MTEASSPPAYIIVDEGSLTLKVAALSVLDRLLVAFHRAGIRDITVVFRGPLPPLPRSRSWGIPFKVAPDWKPDGSNVLWSRSNVLVQDADVRELLARGGRLVTRDGAFLPIAAGRPAGLEWESQGLVDLPAVVTQGVSGLIQDADSAARAGQALWASLTSRSDGWVDRVFNRPCGRYLSKVLIHTSVSPNAVSLASIGIGLAAAWLFSLGAYPALVWGAILFQFSAIVDCVDGDIARVLFKESALGKWLDLAGDQVVHVGVFAGIAWGMAKAPGESPALGLGAAAILGALISFGVVLRGMRQPEASKDGRLRNLIDGATNRDFSVVVLVLALVNRLEWFLWMAAVGSHVFWLAALSLQRRTRARE